MKFWFRRRRDDELDEELRSHLEMARRDRIERGESAEEAAYAARREFGNMALVKETTRTQWGWGWLEHFVQDVVFGIRLLGKNPGFTIAAALILALGIGASTAIFSAVNPILFESLPYPDASQMVMIWDYGVDGSHLEVTFGTFREIAERSHTFAAFAAMKPWQPTVTGGAEPERLEGQRVSADFFRVLGVRPGLGRDFDSGDDRAAGPKVTILSDGLWRRRFGADPSIIGRGIVLDDEDYMVIGVMPASFEDVLAPSAELWGPLQYDISQGRAWGHHLSMVGRLRPGVRIHQGQDDLNQIAKAAVPEFSRPPWASLRQGLVVVSLQEDVTRGVKPALVAVLGAVFLVLLIACANVTNLLLARGARRRGEFAVRVALGAGRARILRQLLTESLLLSFLGGTLGFLFAHFGVAALLALSPPGLPRVSAIRVDGAVFLFALSLTACIGVAAGLIPALRASRHAPQLGLQESSRRGTGRREWMRRALVVGEVALSLVLLVSAGLLVRSLNRLFAISPGFDESRLLTMQVQTSGRRFDKAATNQFFAKALDAVRRVPGVSGTAFASQFPLSGQYDEFGVLPASRPDTAAGAFPAFRYAVSPGYFEAMGIPLRGGRLLNTFDSANGPLAAVVSESLAKKLGAKPLGVQIHIGSADRPAYTVVGVVGDVKQASLASNRADAVYLTPEQWPFPDSAMWLVVRARTDPLNLVPAIRNAIWSVDKDQAIVRIAKMEDLLAATAAERRFAVILFQAFALAALALTATGLFGVLAGHVAERTREIGVRTALGASRGSILALVIRQGIGLTALGAVIGLAGSAAATQALGTLLFRVSRFDLVTYAGGVALLFLVAMLACWIPARRAARVDPMVALRYE